MTKNCRTGEYKKLLAKLPERIRGLAELTFEKFKEDPHSPSLRNHKISDSKKSPHRDGTYSVTLNMSYRALYVTEDDTNVWYWIGSHEDYNNYIRSK